MRRALRIIVMWLLALAVPVQGFAAASMTNCGPGHHGKASSQLQAHAAHAHGHDGAAPDHHDGDADVQADVDTHATPAVHKGSCSACASCCTAAALPAAVVSFDAIVVHNTVVPLAAARVAAFLTGGTERPPRTFLA